MEKSNFIFNGVFSLSFGIFFGTITKSFFSLVFYTFFYEFIYFFYTFYTKDEIEFSSRIVLNLLYFFGWILSKFVLFRKTGLEDPINSLLEIL